MATYAIGDIQGCFDSLQALLEKISYDEKRDRLWLVGDLVNRGPKNLQLLRWARAQGRAVTAVLGNHDLHLIARFHGLAEEKKRDTLEDVLRAEDAEELVSWLTTRPFLHREGDFALVHAGLLPQWSLEQGQALAERAGALLSESPKRFFSLLRAHKKRRWSDAVTPDEQLATAVSALTRIRTCTEQGEMLEFDGPPSEAPAGAVPWFQLRPPAGKEPTLVFGHWAALGLKLAPGAWGLDSGCVWGNRLSAVRLDDAAVFQVDAVEPR